MGKDLLEDRFGRNHHIFAGLGRKGHSGTILAADYGGRLPAEQEVGPVTVVSQPLSGGSLIKFAKRLISEVRLSPPEVVIANGDIPFGLVGLLVARWKRVPFVYDLYDNYLAFASARLPGLRALHGWLLRRADLVIAISTTLAEDVRHLARRVDVIGNGVDTSVFVPMDQTQARAAIGLDEDVMLVGYVGGVTDTRGVRELVEACRGLRGTGFEVELMIVGRNLSTLDLDAPWIHVFGPVDQGHVPTFINTCDVAVSPYLDDSWGRYTHPQKLVEYLACGVPVVASGLPGHMEALDGAGIEWCEPGDIDSLRHALSLQLRSPQPTYLSTSHRWDWLVERAEAALSSLLSMASPGSPGS